MEPIKCTMQDVVNVIPALNDLHTIRLPVKLSLDIRRIEKAVMEEHKYFQEEEKRIIDTYCERNGEGDYIRPPILDSDGNTVVDEAGNVLYDSTKILIEDMDAFQKEFAILLNSEVVLNVRKIALSRIGDIELSYGRIGGLEFLIDNDL